MHRLLELTERTKGQFLDRKFLRRQRRSGAQRLTRLWYLDLDTWLVAGAAQQQQVTWEVLQLTFKCRRWCTRKGKGGVMGQ